MKIHSLEVYRTLSRASKRLTKVKVRNILCSIFRHEMHHVVKVLQDYVANQVIDVMWTEFQNDVTHNVTSLDELIERHQVYVNTCLQRYLINLCGNI